MVDCRQVIPSCTLGALMTLIPATVLPSFSIKYTSGREMPYDLHAWFPSPWIQDSPFLRVLRLTGLGSYSPNAINFIQMHSSMMKNLTHLDISGKQKAL